VKRVCFALVANRAIESKLSVAEWASCDIAIEGLCAIDEDHAYRAMGLLVEADAQAEVQEAVFFAVANLLNLEVDLLFFDTTSTYFERDTEETGDDGFRRYGHSKDNRDGLPRIVIGLALTKEGIPVRCCAGPAIPTTRRSCPRSATTSEAGVSDGSSPWSTAASPAPTTSPTCAAPVGTSSPGCACAITTRWSSTCSPGRAATKGQGEPAGQGSPPR
jgi:hypothetical protein